VNPKFLGINFEFWRERGCGDDLGLKEVEREGVKANQMRDLES